MGESQGRLKSRGRRFLYQLGTELLGKWEIHMVGDQPSVRWQTRALTKKKKKKKHAPGGTEIPTDSPILSSLQGQHKDIRGGLSLVANSGSYSLVAVHKFFIVVTFLVAEHQL